MNDTQWFKLIITVIICTTILLGGCIAWGIANTNWTKELVKTSLEKGQNPVYVKCAMESHSSNECKTMMTVVAITKSDK